MSYPNIKSRRENFFNHWTTPMRNRNNFLNRNPWETSWNKTVPATNIKKGDTLYEMEVRIPGFKKSEISVSLNGGVLSISAEKSKTNFPANEYVLQEFDTDLVERKFKLSEDISKEKIDAVYENGILKLRFIDVSKDKERYVKKVKVA